MDAKFVCVICTVAAISGGCTTPAELMARKPDLEFISQKDPRTMLGCVNAKFTKHTSVTNTLFTEKGFVFYWVKHIDYAVLAVGIEPEGTGSRVRYAQDSATILGSDKWKKLVLECE